MVRTLWKIEDVELDREHVRKARARERFLWRGRLHHCLKRLEAKRVASGKWNEDYIQGLLDAEKEIERVFLRKKK